MKLGHLEGTSTRRVEISCPKDNKSTRRSLDGATGKEISFWGTVLAFGWLPEQEGGRSESIGEWAINDRGK